VPGAKEVAAGFLDFAAGDDSDGYESDPKNSRVDGFDLHFQNATLVG
jgi:hypothetical protein